MNVTDRLFGRCEWVDGCWIYPGGRISSGYGTIWLDGRTRFAHRVAWEVVNGPIPEGMFVCHRCDVRACVRPDHLFLGTHRDNVDDMVAKQRHQAGERHSRAKLTRAQVDEIRTRARAGEGRRVLAAEFSIRPEYVNMLARGVGWAA